MESRTKPTDLQEVPGCPRTVRIYRIAASRNWQFRWFVQGKYVRRSLETEDRKQARTNAFALYKELLTSDRDRVAIHKQSLRDVITHFVRAQELEVEIGNITQRWHRETLYKISKDIDPVLGKREVTSISRETLEEYLRHLSNRQLSRQTLNKHFNLLRKILRFAHERRFIDRVPTFPRIRAESKSRAYFDLESYRRLRKIALDYARAKKVLPYAVRGKNVRNLNFDEDLYDLIVFHANVFVRISDIKDLMHRHVTIDEREPKNRHLEIFSPNSKTADRLSVSMPNAVSVYKRIRRRHSKCGHGKDNDYIFYPSIKDRTYMLQNLQRLFARLLDDGGIRYDQRGNRRTLYSLRHTALMYRILYGQNVDILLLARNALTSVEVLEKFYLSDVEAKQRIDELQSLKRRPSRT